MAQFCRIAGANESAVCIPKVLLCQKILKKALGTESVNSIKTQNVVSKWRIMTYILTKPCLPICVCTRICVNPGRMHTGAVSALPNFCTNKSDFTERRGFLYRVFCTVVAMGVPGVCVCLLHRPNPKSITLYNITVSNVFASRCIFIKLFLDFDILVLA